MRSQSLQTIRPGRNKVIDKKTELKIGKENIQKLVTATCLLGFRPPSIEAAMGPNNKLKG
jgi:hypothetical protein